MKLLPLVKPARSILLVKPVLLGMNVKDAHAMDVMDALMKFMMNR